MFNSCTAKNAASGSRSANSFLSCFSELASVCSTGKNDMTNPNITSTSLQLTTESWGCSYESKSFPQDKMGTQGKES